MSNPPENSTPFLWDFRLSDHKKIDLSTYESVPKELNSDVCHRWEIRYFWPYTGSSPVTVPVFEPDMFDTKKYRFKIHKDLYLLTGNVSDNIKIRKKQSAAQLVYKKRLYSHNGIDGFSKKTKEEITLKRDFDHLGLEDVLSLVSQTHLIKSNLFHVRGVFPVTKESMVIELKVLPVKIEFSKIYIENKTYLSLCLESKDFNALTFLVQNLNYDVSPCSYTHFLKNLL